MHSVSALLSTKTGSRTKSRNVLTGYDEPLPGTIFFEGNCSPRDPPHSGHSRAVLDDGSVGSFAARGTNRETKCQRAVASTA